MRRNDSFNFLFRKKKVKKIIYRQQKKWGITGKNIFARVGLPCFGMRGYHKSEWGVTMVRNIQRGSVPYFETYTGKYIPNPVEVRLYEYDESPNLICDEILALTKMNWNNTQFDRRLPITIECARKVGEILKYLDEGDVMALRYSFYM